MTQLARLLLPTLLQGLHSEVISGLHSKILKLFHAFLHLLELAHRLAHRFCHLVVEVDKCVLILPLRLVVNPNSLAFGQQLPGTALQALLHLLEELKLLLRSFETRQLHPCLRANAASQIIDGLQLLLVRELSITFRCFICLSGRSSGLHRLCLSLQVVAQGPRLLPKVFRSESAFLRLSKLRLLNQKLPLFLCEPLVLPLEGVVHFKANHAEGFVLGLARPLDHGLQLLRAEPDSDIPQILLEMSTLSISTVPAREKLSEGVLLEELLVERLQLVRVVRCVPRNFSRQLAILIPQNALLVPSL